jgi:hypothetical protein
MVAAFAIVIVKTRRFISLIGNIHNQNRLQQQQTTNNIPTDRREGIQKI